MLPTLTQLCVKAAEQLPAFQQRIARLPYERKGVLNSEMFFLYLCAQHAAPWRVLESGRARGQSTLLLSVMFPDLRIISIEHDALSPDAAVARERLSDRPNVELRFGDATRILPAEVQTGDIVLIDGPKGFRGLQLALRLLASGRPVQVFLHDCAVGSPERRFLEANVPGACYSDNPEFARVAHVLDAICRETIPTDRRVEGGRLPPAYGYSLACLPQDAGVSYRYVLMRAALAGLIERFRGGLKA